MRRAVFLSSSALWATGHGPQHPMKPERLKRTHDLLEALGAFEASNVELVEPRMATDEELRLFHTAEYVGAVRALSSGTGDVLPGRFGFGPGDNPVFEGMYETEGHKVGSSLQAAELLNAGACDVAFSYGGGLHHGGPDFASGFCVFNDCAVAIHWLLEQGHRVAYVDIDVHHGDGVQHAFYSDAQVLTISLHQDGRTLFPGTGFVNESGEGDGEGTSVNLPLPPHTDDEIYLEAFGAIVPPLLERFAPDIVVTQLGVDTHYTDPLAQLALTTHGQLALFEELAALAPRWLALGGGGYNIDLVPRAWSLAFGVMAGLNLPDELPGAYLEQYGGETLHDTAAPDLSGPRRRQVGEIVRGVIELVARTHGL